MKASMFNQNVSFPMQENIIQIKGLDSFINFTNYKPEDPSLFLDGVELAEDLETGFGSTLYTKGTLITPKQVTKIIEIKDSYPDLNFFFKINQSEKIVLKFRKDIKVQMLKLFKNQQKSKVLNALLSKIDVNIEGLIDETLSDNNITMAIYQMKYIFESSKIKRPILFLNHSIDVMIISLAIASSKQYGDIVNKDITKLVMISKAGLFHNYGALNKIEQILKLPEDERFELYWEENKNEYTTLENLHLSSEIMDSILLLNEYYMGKQNFVISDGWPATMANIVLVAEAFLRKGRGLFGKTEKVRNILNQFNFMVIENKLNKLAVQTLTFGLNLQNIFDFFQKIDNLRKECPVHSGVPYPFSDFQKPICFVCKNHYKNCKFIDKSEKFINVIKSLGELKPMRYSRCLVLTSKLKDFYDKHSY
ncbi:hypothetical protein ACFL1R_12390 [Candidatus Latescibacterota bacterium]